VLFQIIRNSIFLSFFISSQKPRAGIRQIILSENINKHILDE
jgi:hypothetical protein